MIEESIAALTDEIEALEKQLEGREDAELRSSRDGLVGKRDALATRLGVVTHTLPLWRSKDGVVDSPTRPARTAARDPLSEHAVVGI